MRQYKQDYAGWVEDTAKAIERGNFDSIDLAMLADEVRDLGRSERRELRSALRVLLLHRLKSTYQAAKATKTWDASIRVQLDHVAEFLEEARV